MCEHGKYGKEIIYVEDQKLINETFYMINLLKATNQLFFRFIHLPKIEPFEMKTNKPSEYKDNDKQIWEIEKLRNLGYPHEAVLNMTC